MSLAFLTFLASASLLICATGFAAFNGCMGLATLAGLLALIQAITALLIALLEGPEWKCVR
jgi:glycerol-3-phosphate acyltransferase PlsY